MLCCISALLGTSWIFLNKNAKFSGEQEKESKTFICVREGDKNLFLDKPCDAKQCSLGHILLFHPHTHDTFL